MDQSRGDLLRRAVLFASLGDAAMRDIIQAARPRTVEAGSTFFREGDDAESFFLVQVGSIKLSQVTPEGHLVVLRVIGPGDAFGGVAVTGGALYPVTAQAFTESTALEWSGKVMAALMERHPKLAINALRFVVARLHELQVEHRQLATEKVERRVARALLRLVRQSGRRVDAGVLIDLPLSREDIAQMTGTTLYTVSRIVSRLESDGVLDAGRQRVVIRKPHALMSMADDVP